MVQFCFLIIWNIVSKVKTIEQGTIRDIRLHPSVFLNGFSPSRIILIHFQFILPLFSFEKISTYRNSHIPIFLKQTVAYCTHFSCLRFVHLTIDPGDHPKQSVATLLLPALCSFMWRHHSYSTRPLLIDTGLFLQRMASTKTTTKNSFEQTAFRIFASVSLG